MLFSAGSLLTGVRASAAQNSPVTKTCLQCGAVLPSSVRACNFCDSSFSLNTSRCGDISASSPPESQSQNSAPARAPQHLPRIAQETDQAAAWRDEVAVRMEAYRSRKRRRPPNAAQPQLPFEYSAAPNSSHTLALEEFPATQPSDFSRANVWELLGAAEYSKGS